MPTVDERLKKLEQELQDRCKDLEGRATELEEKWQKFDFKVSALMWLVGIAAALGLTATVLYEPLKNNVAAAIVEYANLQTQIEQVKTSMQSLRPPVNQPQPTWSPEKQNASKPAVLPVKKPTSRALEQINAVLRALQDPAPEPYYTHAYTQDIGQLLNSADLFISEAEGSTESKKRSGG